MSPHDRIFYAIGKRRVGGVVKDGHVELTTYVDEHIRVSEFRAVGKGYVTPCWWLFRQSIRTMMNKAIIRANKLHQKDQKILFGKKMVNETLANIELEVEALKLLDEEFQT